MSRPTQVITGRRLGLLVLTGLVIALGLAAGAAWWLVDVRTVYTFGALDYVAIGLAAVLGERLQLPRHRGRATSMTIAVIGTAILLGQNPAVVAGLAALAWVSHATSSALLGQVRRTGNLLAGAVTAWGLTGLVGLAAALDPIDASELGFNWSSDVSLLSIGVFFALVVCGSPAVETQEIALRAEPGRRLAYRDQLRASWQGDVVLAATATLGALAYPHLAEPTVLIMALPLLAAKIGLERYTEIRRNYDQTLRAMSRLPEQLGAVDPGHGVRVGELAALAAIELGYEAEIVADVERAAQLHELGRIRGEHGIELEPDEIATAGASIVHEAGDLERVAQLIEAHRGPAPVGNEIAWIGGALIRLGCELDLRVHARPTPVLTIEDEAWVRSQTIAPEVAEAVIRSAREYVVPASA